METQGRSKFRFELFSKFKESIKRNNIINFSKQKLIPTETSVH